MRVSLFNKNQIVSYIGEDVSFIVKVTSAVVLESNIYIFYKLFDF